MERQVDEPLIAVYEAPSEFLALSVRDLLQSEGIAAMIQTTHLIGYGNFDFWGAGIYGKVLVFASDEERARELIGAFTGDLGMLEEAEIEEQADQSELPPDGL